MCPTNPLPVVCYACRWAAAHAELAWHCRVYPEGRLRQQQRSDWGEGRGGFQKTTSILLNSQSLYNPWNSPWSNSMLWFFIGSMLWRTNSTDLVSIKDEIVCLYFMDKISRECHMNPARPLKPRRDWPLPLWQKVWAGWAWFSSPSFTHTMSWRIPCPEAILVISEGWTKGKSRNLAPSFLNSMHLKIQLPHSVITMAAQQIH